MTQSRRGLPFLLVTLTALTAGSPGAAEPDVPAHLKAPALVRPLAQFGAPGAEPGRFRGPAAAAAGPDGGWVVADAGNHRVQVLQRDGAPVRQWGTLGDTPGQFRFPQGIAVAPDGQVVVADTGNHRVQVFDPAGKFLREWGGFGEKEGRFNHPRGLAVTGDRVVVTDTRNQRLQVFTREGVFLRAFGQASLHQAHDTHVPRIPGFVDQPLDVALDAVGNIYLADSQTHRVQKFDRTGRFLTHWGTWGFRAGLFREPAAVAVRGERVFVADRGNHRVQVFDADGGFLAQWGRHPVGNHEGNGHLHQPAALAVAPDGKSVLVCEPGEDRCQVFPVFGTPEPAKGPPSPWWKRPARFFTGGAAAADDTRLVVSEPGMHALLTFTLGAAQAAPIPDRRIGLRGQALGQFRRPGLPVPDGQAGTLTVTDTGNHRLQVLRWPVAPHGGDPRVLTAVGKRTDWNPMWVGDGPEGFPGLVEPTALARGPEARWYVLDSGAARVAVFRPDLTFQGTWGARGGAEGQLREPVALARDPAGTTLYVADRDNFRVQAFDRQGKVLRAWGGHGPDRGQFLAPAGIAVDGEGHVYVTDALAHRVQKFDGKGKWLAAWGERGAGTGQFHRPGGVTVDGRGRVIVIDHGNHRGQVFTPTGKHVATFGLGPLYTGGTTPTKRPPAPAPMMRHHGVETSPKGVQSNGGTYFVSYDTVPPIQANVPFTLKVEVFAAGDHEQPLRDTKTLVDARMPAHNHGMNHHPLTLPQGDGSFQVTGMRFHMSGHWELYVDVMKNGIVERAQFDVLVP